MPALRTEITEIVTGLAMLGGESVDDALAQRPDELVDVDDATWDRLVRARHDRTHDHDFLAAWNNGRAFLVAREGLRGRRPVVVEWKGGHRDPGDVVVPSDLRVDHVYLVSCKYLSKVLHNASPWALFDHHLVGALARRSEGDWFDAVAPREHQELYRLVRQRYAADLALPEAIGALERTPAPASCVAGSRGTGTRRARRRTPSCVCVASDGVGGAVVGGAGDRPRP